MNVPPITSGPQGASNGGAQMQPPMQQNTVQGYSSNAAIIPPGDNPGGPLATDPHYANGKLTHAGMVAKIGAGGSILYTGKIGNATVTGKIISSIAELPSLTDMAETSGNPDDLNAQIAKNEQLVASTNADTERLRAALVNLAKPKAPPAVVAAPAAVVIDQEKEELKARVAKMEAFISKIQADAKPDPDDAADEETDPPVTGTTTAKSAKAAKGK